MNAFVRCVLPFIFIITCGNVFAQKKGDCDLLTDRKTDEGYIRSTHRTAIIEQPDQGFGIILQNYSGSLVMLIDWAFAATRIKNKFTAANKNTVTFVLKNGSSVHFEISEPQQGSGSRKQSWGNYEVGGMIDVSPGQADTLQESPINKMLLSFYGLPADTISAIPAKDYFIKNLPCVR